LLSVNELQAEVHLDKGQMTDDDDVKAS